MSAILAAMALANPNFPTLRKLQAKPEFERDDFRFGNAANFSNYFVQRLGGSMVFAYPSYLLGLR